MIASRWGHKSGVEGINLTLGSDAAVLPATWMSLQEVETMFTAAMFFRPCQAEWRFPLSLYFSLAVFIALLISLLTSIFQSQCQ